MKDDVAQSGIFTLCAFALFHVAFTRWNARQRGVAAICMVLGLLFIANMIYVVTSRTALVVIPVLYVLFAYHHGLHRRSFRAIAAYAAIGAVAVGAVWATSQNLRARVTVVSQEISEHAATGVDTSSGARLEFWKYSLRIVAETPLIGHGTGTIADEFRRHADGPTGATATNPHNQIFTVAIQLGAVGVIILLAMWAAHWLMFLGPGLPAWIGLMVVTQNIVGCQFNSHLLDFTQGWLYVFGVGVFGGTVLRRRVDDARGAGRPSRPCRRPHETAPMKPFEMPSDKPLDLPPRPRVLVVALRRLGDVLFATPLIASIRRAFPQARIDALVFADTAGMLAGNPDLDRIVTMPPARGTMASLALALRLFKRYDLAVSTQSGDRPTFFALLAGRRHVGPIDGGRRGALRRRVLSRAVPNAPGLHRLEEMLRLADALGIARVPRLVCPGGAVPRRLAAGPYAVIHAAPNFTYKRWTRDGWRASPPRCATAASRSWRPAARPRTTRLSRRRLAASTGASPRIDGALTWPELTALMARRSLYVGPDTSVTHLAAAIGCPTVALYGPTDPRLWGPVPPPGSIRMWQAAGTIQRRGNVWLVQNPLPCLPCQNEGCERHLTSFSRCLDELAPAQVCSRWTRHWRNSQGHGDGRDAGLCDAGYAAEG